MEKELTKLEIDCESIRKDIKECGKLYITVAYKVYELYIYGIYKEKYKNIVECCEKEFCFKKSTTYRFLGIVEEFGEKENGIVTYRSLIKYDKFSYSQLTEMLSLSDVQRKKVTPDMTVSKIRDMKKTFSAPVADSHKVEKVPTSGKVKVSESEPEIIEVLPEQLQVVADSHKVEKVPTSGKIENNLVRQQLELYDNNVEKTISGLIERINSFEFSTNHFRNLFEHREKVIKQLKEEKEQLYKESENKLRNLLEKSDVFREQVLENKETIKSQSETIADYMKRNEKLIYRNTILETDNKMLKTKVQQLKDEIEKLKSE